MLSGRCCSQNRHVSAVWEKEKNHLFTGSLDVTHRRNYAKLKCLSFTWRYVFKVIFNPCIEPFHTMEPDISPVVFVQTIPDISPSPCCRHITLKTECKETISFNMSVFFRGRRSTEQQTVVMMSSRATNRRWIMNCSEISHGWFYWDDSLLEALHSNQSH